MTTVESEVPSASSWPDHGLIPCPASGGPPHFGTLKTECVWQNRFQDRDQAFALIARWIEKYDAERPHSALGYLTPAEFRERLAGC
ncbi:integrase core domain-containing protein [Parvibaculum sp.]|uniref:integrase core domain-containing protein n=1 Tax=Parvibaculum sp. TaxID=2024848 RepID=UPI003BABD0A0